MLKLLQPNLPPSKLPEVFPEVRLAENAAQGIVRRVGPASRPRGVEGSITGGDILHTTAKKNTHKARTTVCVVSLRPAYILARLRKISSSTRDCQLNIQDHTTGTPPHYVACDQFSC